MCKSVWWCECVCVRVIEGFYVWLFCFCFGKFNYIHIHNIDAPHFDARQWIPTVVGVWCACACVCKVSVLACKLKDWFDPNNTFNRNIIVSKHIRDQWPSSLYVLFIDVDFIIPIFHIQLDLYLRIYPSLSRFPFYNCFHFLLDL